MASELELKMSPHLTLYLYHLHLENNTSLKLHEFWFRPDNRKVPFKQTVYYSLHDLVKN